MKAQESIAKARRHLINRGICSRDGSGEPNVEALFIRLAKAEFALSCIKSLSGITYKEIHNVEAVNHTFNVINDHSITALSFLKAEKKPEPLPSLEDYANMESMGHPIR